MTKVLADRENINRVYVTLSGYRYGEDDGNVYVSNFRGQGWGAIGASLPDIPINDVVKDANGVLYLATDIGVFAAASEAYSWEVIDGNMPAVVVNDLHIHEPSNTLYAATYGRSIYKLDLGSVVLGTSEVALLDDMLVYPNPASDKVQIKLAKQSGEATVLVVDALGRTVATYSFKNRRVLEVPLSGLERGTYFLKVNTESGTATKKLIVK